MNNEELMLAISRIDDLILDVSRQEWYHINMAAAKREHMEELRLERVALLRQWAGLTEGKVSES